MRLAAKPEARLDIGDIDDENTSRESINGNLTSPTQTDTYRVDTNGGLEVTPDTMTAARSFDEDLRLLNSILPKWDRRKLVAVARDESKPINSRIVAIRQLRELLSDLIVKAYKNNRPDRIEAMIRVWKDLDQLAEKIIGDRSITKIAFLNVNIRQVSLIEELAIRQFEKRASYYSGVFYEMFRERFDQAIERRGSKRDLSLDMTLSARSLLLTALGVR